MTTLPPLGLIDFCRPGSHPGHLCLGLFPLASFLLQCLFENRDTIGQLLHMGLQLKYQRLQFRLIGLYWQRKQSPAHDQCETVPAQSGAMVCH
ncbi:hypothetical protein [Nitrosomonas halophila]|uniref:hypothetical protein n=1 Tax=Nitrosomonas halophila TaxID=44576 RepID=UPI00115FA28D|nr:hypothetical protein [Nitrosomonas halophila]